MQLGRWICGVILHERKSSEELRDSLGIESISNIMQQMHLRWFGQEERMDTENWTSKYRNLMLPSTSGKEKAKQDLATNNLRGLV